MRYYPVYVDIKDKPCAVIGGGEVAERKVLSLIEAGANVTVISPKTTKTIKELASTGRVTVYKRKYKKGDLKGTFLTVSATDSKEVNGAVFEEATELNILVNVVDDPPHCNFIVPSVVKRGDLTIAISTAGKSPYLAKTIRIELEKKYGVEYGPFVDILGAVRNKLLKSRMNHDKKERVFKALASSPVPSLIREKRASEIDRLLKSFLGEGYTLKSLGINLKGFGE